MNLLQLIKDHISLETHPVGHTIIRKGEESGYMYVIQDGAADVWLDGQYIRTLGKGDIFGEMALIDGAPHSADIVAKTDCTVAPVDERRFLFLVHENPIFALHIMRLMAQRLRK